MSTGEARANLDTINRLVQGSIPCGPPSTLTLFSHRCLRLLSFPAISSRVLPSRAYFRAL